MGETIDALLTGQSIQQGRFADVGAADDGDLDASSSDAASGSAGKVAGDMIEKADRIRAHARTKQEKYL